MKNESEVTPVTAPQAECAPREAVAQVAEDFIFFLRKRSDGSRWPVGTKLYADPQAIGGRGEAADIDAQFKSM